MIPAPKRLLIRWSVDAQRDVRAIERSIALEILYCVDSYLLTRVGDVKKLKPPLTGYRLRCGNFRIFFRQWGEEGVEIRSVLDRKNAYR